MTKEIKNVVSLVPPTEGSKEKPKAKLASEMLTAMAVQAAKREKENPSNKLHCVVILSDDDSSELASANTVYEIHHMLMSAMYHANQFCAETSISHVHELEKEMEERRESPES